MRPEGDLPHAAETAIGSKGAACDRRISPALRSSSSATNATACSRRESPSTSSSKTNPEPSQEGAKALEKTFDRRQAQRQVRQRRRRRFRSQGAERAREPQRVLRIEGPDGRRCERSGAETEVPVGLRGQAPLEPLGAGLDPTVRGEPLRELGRRLGCVEVVEIEVVVLGEDIARLQLEQRGDEHEELAADLQLELRLPRDARRR